MSCVWRCRIVHELLMARLSISAMRCAAKVKPMPRLRPRRTTVAKNACCSSARHSLLKHEHAGDAVIRHTCLFPRAHPLNDADQDPGSFLVRLIGSQIEDHLQSLVNHCMPKGLCTCFIDGKIVWNAHAIQCIYTSGEIATRQELRTAKR